MTDKPPSQLRPEKAVRSEFNDLRSASIQAPEGCRTTVGDDRTFAGPQQGSREVLFPGRWGSSNPERSRQSAFEAPTLPTVADRLGAQPSRLELSMVDYPVLSAGRTGGEAIWVVRHRGIQPGACDNPPGQTDSLFETRPPGP